MTRDHTVDSETLWAPMLTYVNEGWDGHVGSPETRRCEAVQAMVEPSAKVDITLHRSVQLGVVARVELHNGRVER